LTAYLAGDVSACCIKNKLVTAVTTAGLLAGLFGSAFVPAARGAALTDNDAPQTMAYAAASATDTTYAYYTTAAFPVFTVNINPDTNDGDDGTFSVSVSGGTIRSCTIAGTSMTPGSVVATATSCSVALAFPDAANDSADWTVTLNKLTAGQTVTVTVADDNTQALLDSRKIRGITAASLSAISSVNTDAVDAGADSAFDTTVASLWTLGYDELGVVQVDLKNAYDTNPTTFPLVEARITGPMSVAATTDNDCDEVAVPLASYGSSSTALSASDTADDINVCVISTDEDSTSAGVGTLTIIAGGVTVLTQRINMIGDATSIVLTQNMKHFAVGATLDGTVDLNVAKITYKDAAGNTLTAGDFDASVAFSIGGVTTALADAGVGGAFELVHASEAGYVSLGNICAGKVSGDTVKIDLEYENVDEDLVTSSLTMTCTDADGKITNIKMAASAANPGSDVKLNLTVVDSAGRACGYGCTIPNATLVTRTPAGTNADESIDTLTEVNGGDELTEANLTGALFGANLVDGTAWVKIQTPSTKGTYAAIIDYADIETGGAVALPGSWTIRLVSSDVAAAPSSTGLTAGAKKLTATADFGATAGGAKIAFTLERSNGTVKTYYRKANADGVAKFTLRFRGTYEVTASYGDYITDTVILRKR
jgi:hypothetical protein